MFSEWCFAFDHSCQEPAVGAVTTGAGVSRRSATGGLSCCEAGLWRDSTVCATHLTVRINLAGCAGPPRQRAAAHLCDDRRCVCVCVSVRDTVCMNDYYLGTALRTCFNLLGRLFVHLYIHVLGLVHFSSYLYFYNNYDIVCNVSTRKIRQKTHPLYWLRY